MEIETMSKTDTGGPAYPYQEYQDASREVEWQTGNVTVLDKFAGQSLAGSRANPETHADTSEQFAKWAYEDAIAMMAEKRRLEAAGDESCDGSPNADGAGPAV